MGSGDLNLLKSWNPKLLKNRRKVWEREQEVKREEEKFIQRQKEIKREKELNELINSTRDPALKRNLLKNSKNGLEWMYNDKDNLPEENEDYLLGKKKLDTTVIKVRADQSLYRDVDSDKKNPFLTSSVGAGVSLKSSLSSSKKKIDYSNDDPMAKLMSKHVRETKKITKITKRNTSTNKQSNYKSKFKQMSHNTESKKYDSIDY